MSLIDRVRRTRIVQVMLVYSGTSWAILEFAGMLHEFFGLPDWLMRGVMLLLMVGFVVVAATALVQGDPNTDEREEAGEVPTTWEVAPTEAIQSIFSGNLPHLTWGRAMVGGVVALSLLFGFAGLVVLVRGGEMSSSFGVREATADEVATGLVIVPFSVSGEDLNLWREGLVDLFAANLDGVGGYRTIDSRTLLARWNEVVPEGEEPDLEVALEVARSTGARFGLVGSAVALGGSLRLSADLHDLETGVKMAQLSVDGSPDDVLRLVDELSVAVMSEILAQEDRALPRMQTAASLTTSSLPALQSYLEGEARLRRSDFEGAKEAFASAIADDSTFAMAYVRLSLAEGWTGTEDGGTASLERAVALMDRLPPRERILVQGQNAYIRGAVGGHEAVESAVRRYPDDPELLELLGEFYVHTRYVDLLDPSRMGGILERAPQLDPSFAPGYIHLIEHYLAEGDSAGAAEALAGYVASSERESEDRWLLESQVLLLFGEGESRQRLVDALDTLPDSRRSRLLELDVGVAPANLERWERLEGLAYDPSVYAAARGKASALAGVFSAFPSASWSIAVTGPALFGEPAVEPLVRDALTEECDLCLGPLLYRAAWSDGATDDAIRIPLEESLAILEEDELSEVAAAIEDILAAVLDRRKGRKDAALDEFDRIRATGGAVQEFVGALATLFAAEIHFEEGRFEEARDHYQALSRDLDPLIAVHSVARLGEVFEALAEREAALASWQEFLIAWGDADDGLVRLEAAREAVRRLGG